MIRLASIPAPLRNRLLGLLPATAAIATLAWIGLRGLGHPITLLLAGCWLATILGMLLVGTPHVLFALFPTTMVWYLGLPVEPFDLALLLLAGISILPLLPRWRMGDIHLNRIEGTYGLFLICLFTTLAMPFEARRLLGVAKSYAFGLLAYEVARHEARRHGRRSLLWGLTVLSSLTVVLLILRHAASGVATGQIMRHRTLLTDVSWGSSNYVAAVLVILIPAALCLLQNPENSRGSRRLAIVALVGTFVGVLLTTSRGGFLLALLAALIAARRLWRAPLRLIGAGAVATLLLLMPSSTGIMQRFKDPQGIYSIAARWEVWKAAWERGASHLPFGIGHGQGRTYGDALGDIDPHNFPLTLFSEGGPPALIVWLMLLYAVWRRGRALTRTPGEETAGRALMLLTALAFLNSLFEPTFSGHLYHTLFWWSVGALDGGSPVGLRDMAAGVRASEETRAGRSVIPRARP